MRWRLALGYSGGMALAMGWGLVACGSDGNVDGTGDTANTGSATGGGDGSGNGSGDGGTGDLLTGGVGGDGAGGDDSCAAVTQEASVVNRPVDIIIAIDNSGSMGGEISEVEVQITKNFASILDAAMPPIDYRVIMVSRFGNFNGPESICVSAPLGGIPDNDMDGHCDSIPGQPVETANFFHHSVEVSSHNALCRLLEQYDVADEFNLRPNGYRDLVRADAFKFFLVITDDGVSCSHGGTNYQDGNNVAGGTQVATDWDAAITALDPLQFGTPTDRNYVFWSIVSQQEWMKSATFPLGEPIPATEPITSAECNDSLNPNKSGGGAADPGTGYQGLSILTDGFRYPTCALEYTDMFSLMAQGVIDGAQVPCAFEIPEAPPGEELDLDSVEVVYSSAGSEVSTYDQVADETACTPSSFYIDGDDIVLCPGACTVVQADTDAKVDLRFACTNDVF
ncbi:MAG: hypothetical protein AAGN82_28405 [Myxococcota bacterium]